MTNVPQRRSHRFCNKIRKNRTSRSEERSASASSRAVCRGYGAAPMLIWLVEEKGIAPHIPVFKSKRDDGTFSRTDFQYDRTNDVYRCPGGEQLGTSGTVHEGKALLYRASKLDSDVCPLKPKCFSERPIAIPRDIHEHARDVAPFARLYRRLRAVVEGAQEGRDAVRA